MDFQTPNLKAQNLLKMEKSIVLRTPILETMNVRKFTEMTTNFYFPIFSAGRPMYWFQTSEISTIKAKIALHSNMRGHTGRKWVCRFHGNFFIWNSIAFKIQKIDRFWKPQSLAIPKLIISFKIDQFLANYGDFSKKNHLFWIWTKIGVFRDINYF